MSDKTNVSEMRTEEIKKIDSELGDIELRAASESRDYSDDEQARVTELETRRIAAVKACLLYTSDAADE